MLAVTITAVLAGCGSPESWRSEGGSGSRSLCAQRPGPDHPRLIWAVHLDAANPGAPVVGDGGIYVPHSGGSVTKLGLDGGIQWRFDSWLGALGELPPHLVLLPQGEILVCTRPPREETFVLTAMGEVSLGPPKLPWPAASSPACNSADQLVACHQYIYRENAVGLRIFGLVGNDLWLWDWAQAGQSSFASNPVLLEDGRAFVFIENSVGNNVLVALDPRGRCQWQREFPAVETKGVGRAIAASPSGAVYFGTPRIEDIAMVYSPGWLYAVDDQGELLWRIEAGHRVEQIFVAPDLVVANLLRTKLLALNCDGEEIWQCPLAGWESNGVMDSRGRIYLGGVKDGAVWLRAVDAKGRGIWEFATKERAESISYLALANGVIYLATSAGTLLAIAD